MLEFLPAIGKGIDLVSSFLGGRKDRKAQENANRQNAELQRDFAQSGITWRVQDAKRAGLHPLYALGAQVTPGQASFVPSVGRGSTDFQGMGQDISRAASASSEAQKQLQSAQLRVLESEAARNEAEAGAIRSREMRTWLEGGISRGIGLDGGGLRADPFWSLSGDAVGRTGPHRVGDLSSLVKTTPSETRTNRPGDNSTEAAVPPAYKEHFISPFGLKGMAYGSEEGFGEAMENMGLLSFIWQNTAKYGADWLDQYVRQVWLGQSPKFRQVPPGSEPHGFRGLKPRGWVSPQKRGHGRSQ